MGYDRIVEDALRGVVREALTRAGTAGLPGDHHFYITYRTDAPGVVLPRPLRERHPEEITIVIQHQFWDLAVGRESFSVTLSFGGKAERLEVPFGAVTGFADPSVQFGLQFEAGRASAGRPPPADAGEGDRKDAPASAASADVVVLDRFRDK